MEFEIKMSPFKFFVVVVVSYELYSHQSFDLTANSAAQTHFLSLLSLCKEMGLCVLDVILVGMSVSVCVFLIQTGSPFRLCLFDFLFLFLIKSVQVQSKE